MTLRRSREETSAQQSKLLRQESIAYVQVTLGSDGADGSRRVTMAEPEVVNIGWTYHRAQPNSLGLAAQPLQLSLVPATLSSKFEVNDVRRHDRNHRCTEDQHACRARKRARAVAEAELHTLSIEDALRALILAKRQARTVRVLAKEQPRAVHSLVGLPG